MENSGIIPHFLLLSFLRLGKHNANHTLKVFYDPKASPLPDDKSRFFQHYFCVY